MERRALLRDFESHKYHIESIQEALQGHEYGFLRQPKKAKELELTPLIDFYHLHKESVESKVKKKRKTSSCSTAESYIEDLEEDMAYIGVPTLLENYVILNREGKHIELTDTDHLWLCPLEEELKIEQKSNKGEILDFVSDWFSGEQFSDLDTNDARTLSLVTEKITVISSAESCASGEEVWFDAPEIPYWLDEEQEELELFNRPSRPLYYYRDRIKGSYRIIGVEDEKVVLFSENDDDNIFYSEDMVDNSGSFAKPGKLSNAFISNFKSIQNCNRRGSPVDGIHKNDSGIEDVDDMTSEDFAIASIALSQTEAQDLGFHTYQLHSINLQNSPNFLVRKDQIVQTIGSGMIIASAALVLYCKLNGIDVYTVHNQLWDRSMLELASLYSKVFQ